MTTEIELKYQLLTNSEENNAVADNITTMLTALNITFEKSQFQLMNDYYETELLTLRKLDFGLRIRTKEKQYEQTIKTAGKVIGCLHQRPEHNISIDRNQLNLTLFPKSIWPENVDVIELQKNLRVVFSTNFSRQTWLIHQGNNVMELALDNGKIFVQDSNESVVINEIEIELVRGDEQALFTLAKELAKIITMEPGKHSKAARGYSLYNGTAKS